MLYNWTAGLVGKARAGSDAQLALRADTGTGTLATIAGCELIPSDYCLPWTTHLSHDAMAAFDASGNLAERGIMPEVREYYAAVRERLPEEVHCFCADTQGPFDLVHLLYGNDLFYAVYDEPEFIHALLEKVTQLYIEGTRMMKSWISEPLDEGFHFDLALAYGGVRVCEDSSTLLSPTMVAEFVLPYQRRALEAFGGGFVQYCGHNDALYAGVLANPAVRGLNFGNPERHDFAKVIPDLQAAGKCYYGAIPRAENETLDVYFRRVIGYTGGRRKGLIFTPHLRAEEAAEPQQVLDTWRALQ